MHISIIYRKRGAKNGAGNTEWRTRNTYASLTGVRIKCSRNIRKYVHEHVLVWYIPETFWQLSAQTTFYFQYQTEPVLVPGYVFIYISTHTRECIYTVYIYTHRKYYKNLD